MGLSAILGSKVSYNLTGTPDIGTAQALFAGHDDIQLDSGTAAGHADRVFSDSRVIASASNDDIDLSGTLVDPIGGSALFVKIKAILVKSRASNTTDLSVGPAATNGLGTPFSGTTPAVKVQPGGTFALYAPATGFAVTAGTGDLLRVANAAGASATYDIIIIGTSA